MLKGKNLKGNQQGFASIIIALILIVVLALITVGFTQLARREQQDALNKQLANQASYAAESGANDVYNSIYGSASNEQAWLYAATNGQVGANNRVNGVTLDTVSADTCLDATNLKALLPANSASNSEIDSNTDVSYSCVLLDLAPTDISGQGLIPGQTKNFSIGTLNGSDVTQFTFSWESHDSGPAGTPTAPHTNYNLPNDYLSPANDWANSSDPGSQQGGPLIQLSMTPYDYNGTLSRSDLLSKSFTAYLYPSNSSGGSITTCPSASPCTAPSSSSPDSQAPIWDGSCRPSPHPNRPLDCSVTFNLPSGESANTYSVNLTSFYDSADFQMTGLVNNAGSSVQAHFIGQAVIDVTAKAKNVLKRVRIVTHTCDSTSCQAPSSALEGTICKREQTGPHDPTYNVYGTQFIPPDNSPGPDYACILQ